MGPSHSQVLEKATNFETMDESQGLYPDLNMGVENCQSYPYHNYSVNGLSNVHEDFQFLVQKSSLCLSRKFEGREAPKFAQQKLKELFKLLLSPKKKTVACTFGEYHSFFAVSNSGLNPDDIGPGGVFLDMPEPPSIYMDTNRMAGNFPLNMDEDDIDGFYNFYGDSLKDVVVESGKRNPLYHKTENSSSLLFHEMMHWTGLSHHPDEYPDLVYLSQLCCFQHDSISENQRQRACEILYEPKFWSGTKDQRLQALKAQSIHEEVNQLIDQYHGR